MLCKTDTFLSVSLIRRNVVYELDLTLQLQLYHLSYELLSVGRRNGSWESSTLPFCLAFFRSLHSYETIYVHTTTARPYCLLLLPFFQSRAHYPHQISLPNLHPRYHTVGLLVVQSYLLYSFVVDSLHYKEQIPIHT